MEDGSNGLFDPACPTLKQLRAERLSSHFQQDMEVELARARRKLAQFRHIDRQTILDERRAWEDATARRAAERYERSTERSGGSASLSSGEEHGNVQDKEALPGDQVHAVREGVGLGEGI